jgi:4-amino-4-deoxy-L-arabinose transferase-like glycosyltransferase
MRPPARAALFGALFAAVVTLPGLGSGTLWDNSETAYGEVAREIVLTHDWVVMHLNAQPWFIQPPLYFWIAAAFAKLLGIGPFAMRLPAALATIAMSGALGAVVAAVCGARTGVLAAAILTTSLMQAVIGRLAIMDALLDLAVMVAILWWFRALAPEVSGGAPGARRNVAFVCGAAALAFGTLAKGPVAPAVVVLVIGAWLVWERRLRTPVVLPSIGTLVVALGLFALIALPWFVTVSMRVGPQAAGELIGHYTIGRYTGVIENQTGPWWYYLPVLILGFFPWIAFLPVALLRDVRRAAGADAAFTRLALSWALVPFVFFSFAQTKLPNYIALLLPALAIVTARAFAAAVDAADRRWILISAAALPVFAAAVVVAGAIFSRTNAFELAGLVPYLAVLGYAVLGTTVVTVVAFAVARTQPVAPFVLTGAMAAVLLFIALIAQPAAEPLKPMPSIARKIQAQRAPGATVAIRSVNGSNGLTYYTSPGVVTIDGTDSAYRALICATPDLYLVTRAQDVPELANVARRLGRRANDLGAVRRVTALHVDGPGCTSRG